MHKLHEALLDLESDELLNDWFPPEEACLFPITETDVAPAPSSEKTAPLSPEDFPPRWWRAPEPGE